MHRPVTEEPFLGLLMAAWIGRLMHNERGLLIGLGEIRTRWPRRNMSNDSPKRLAGLCTRKYANANSIRKDSPVSLGEDNFYYLRVWNSAILQLARTVTPNSFHKYYVNGKSTDSICLTFCFECWWFCAQKRCSCSFTSGDIWNLDHIRDPKPVLVDCTSGDYT